MARLMSTPHAARKAAALAAAERKFWRPGNGSEGELHALVAADKAQALVKAVGREAGFVGGQLDEGAAALTSMLNGPSHHDRTSSLASQLLGYSHPFNLCTPGSPAGEAGDEAELERGHHLTAEFSHYQKVGGVGFDCVKSQLVRVRSVGPFSG